MGHASGPLAKGRVRFSAASAVKLDLDPLAVRPVTLADRGTTAHVVSVEMATELVEAGVARRMEQVGDEWIVFGKEGATEKVVARLCGTGVDPLMDDVKVVVNVLSCLISDQLLTAQGVLMANDDQRLVGIGRDADGDWYEVVAGTRDSAAQAGDAASLWVLDPIKLFTARRPAGYNSFGLGDPVGDMLSAMQVKPQGGKAGALRCRVRQQREQLMDGLAEDLLPAMEAGDTVVHWKSCIQ